MGEFGFGGKSAIVPKNYLSLAFYEYASILFSLCRISALWITHTSSAM